MRIIEYKTYLEDEILHLYQSVGWTAYTENPAVLKAGFENSLLTLAAYDGDKLTGIIRTVGDGQTIIYIQDILVLPEYQRQGIGTGLLKEVEKRFEHVRQIVLTADNTPETVGFYKSLGFELTEKVGCCGFIKR